MRPPAAGAQQMTAPVESAINPLTTPAPGTALSQALRPPAPNPFQRPGSSAHQAPGDPDSPDSLALHLDHNWASASAHYAFTAPPAFYVPARDAFETRDWSSSTITDIRAYLGRSNTMTARMTGDLEIYGQRREAGAPADPGGESFTMQWELAKLLFTRLGPLEIAAGRFQQQLVSNPAFANSPITDVWAGYSASFGGFETTLTLPDKNLAFSLRFGSQYLGPALGKAHTAVFELSWTW